jgi:predicted PurR-regulated permease PerM
MLCPSPKFAQGQFRPEKCTVLMQPIKHPFYARLAYILVSIVLIILLLEQGRDIFIPLVFGLLIAILLYPLNRFFEHKMKLGRGISAILCLFLFLICLGGFIYFLTFQVANFSQDFPILRDRMVIIADDLQQYARHKLGIDMKHQREYINQSASKFLESAARSAGGIFFSLTSTLLLAIFVFMFTFFTLFHRRLLMRFTLHLFRLEHREKVREVVMETKAMINGYIAGLLIEMVIMSIACSGLLLIMGVKYAVLLGIVVAVLNIIPYLGFYSATAFTMLVTFTNSSASMMMEAAIGLFVLHFIDSNILMPRIVGKRVKMNPFITIIAVIIGEFVWGIPGMFLFIPLTGIIKLICERVEGLEAWGLLIGVDEAEHKPTKKISLEETTDTQ